MVRAALVSLLLLVGVAAAVSAAPRVRVLRIATPPTIDGKLDDPIYENPPQIGDLTMVVPVSGAQPTQQTELWIFTTDTHLYVGVRCHDSDPGGIVAQRMIRDDDLIPDDRVGITVGPYGDRRNGYFFQVNPNAVRRDVLLEGQTFETNWDGFWQAKTTTDAGGWSAEFAIPYQTISFDPNVDTWDFNVHRVVRRLGERTRWSDDRPSRNILEVGLAGTLEGMRDLDQGLGLEVVPSFTSRYIADPNDEDDWENDPSGDAFYKLTPSLTASATANTDFGETEVDLRRVNLTRFGLFFPEKRDFFLEDGLIFDFAGIEENGRPFFSRKVGLDANGEQVDILGAGKLTGRVGPMKIGALHAQMDGHAGVTNQALTVVRPALNVFGESTLGGIVTNGDPSGETENTLVGVDFLYRKSDFFDRRALEGGAWIQRSFSRNGQPGQDDNDDEFAYGLSLSYPNDIWNWDVGYREIQEDFNPALGFVNRVGIREYRGRLRHRRRWSGWLRTWDREIEGRLVTDRRGSEETARVDVTPVELSTDVGDRIEFTYVHRYERPTEDFELDGGLTIDRGRYHFDAGRVTVESSQHRVFSATVVGAYGTFYDGYQTFVSTLVAWRPSRHWLIAPEYVFRDLHMPSGKQEVHLARLRINVQFTSDISWVTLVQWDDVTDEIGVNTRFRWIVEDGREFFIVLNQELDASDDIGGIERGRTEPFVKLEWAFRF